MGGKNLPANEIYFEENFIKSGRVKEKGKM